MGTGACRVPARGRTGILALLAASATIGIFAAAGAAAAPGGNPLRVTQISADPLSDPLGQHRTQVEPDSFSNGERVVAVMQNARVVDGGGSAIAWATSSRTGGTWTTGLLPGVTTATGGAFARASDPSVAYDRAHRTWLVASLGLTEPPLGAAIVISRSHNGRSWKAPVTAVAAGPASDLDKQWIVCDPWRASPYYGHCYLQWDDFGTGNLIMMSTSTDGGRTWSAPVPTAGLDRGIGGQPVVQPDGTVVVPMNDIAQVDVLAYRSTDGGASWTKAVQVAPSPSHLPAGPLRSSPLPSAEVDGSGRVYAAWHDCRLRPGCTANDIELSWSDDGVTWSPPQRVPFDAAGGSAEHVIPGLAVDPAQRGRLAVTAYSYPAAACTLATCELNVDFTSSTDGGATWSAPVRLAGPMRLGWLAPTTQGFMVGDYISTSFLRDRAIPVFVAARAPHDGALDEATFSARIDVGPGTVAGGEDDAAAPAAGAAAPLAPRAGTTAAAAR